VDLDQLMQAERRDLGVQPTHELHGGTSMGRAASIPVTDRHHEGSSRRCAKLMPLRCSVYRRDGGLPGAVPAAWASQSGTLKDQVQQAFVQLLQQQTGGNKQMPLVFYCLSRECWMSYNAALRAIAAGYGNVLWYRGGLEAWKLAGLPTQPGRGGASGGSFSTLAQPSAADDTAAARGPR
jgi:rhodanese-related sulfurtransferase